MTEQSCTGIILAGGESKRLNGIEKSNLVIGNKSILESIMPLFSALFAEIILVTNHPKQFLKWNVTIVKDIFPQRSSLTGIHSGLFFTKTAYAFITACDAPFLKKEIVKLLLQNIEPNVDVVIPRTSSGYEPLCAVYSKQCLQPIQRALTQKKLKILYFFNKIAVKEIPDALLRKSDSDLISFFNINTPKDLETAKQMVKDNQKAVNLSILGKRERICQ